MLNDTIIMDDERERMLKAYFKVLSQHLTRRKP
jgi:hypothetical protein